MTTGVAAPGCRRPPGVAGSDSSVSTERVTALGDRIQARSREDGPGWAVLAVLPAAPGAAR
ncbi:hypothetical protein P1P68_36690 [Streptomyces scabiei]|uniref:hypothetical protein n=1 Tax=Streptomyces scabiei TaxID=1930 RepID=UPI00298F5279|nr:hypothetical protein [Streptomyces scabiei]MDW8810189.1 hypothetical protein [Streptomyces scabiei]